MCFRYRESDGCAKGGRYHIEKMERDVIDLKPNAIE